MNAHSTTAAVKRTIIHHTITRSLFHHGIVELEYTGVIALQFTSGALGTINYTGNSHLKNMEGSITVFGDRGTVKVGGHYLNVLEYKSIADYEIPDLPQSRPANEYDFYQNVLDVLDGLGLLRPPRKGKSPWRSSR